MNEDLLEIQQKIKNSYPSKRGLRIDEIIVLYYASIALEPDNEKFPSCLKYQYGITEPHEILDKLLSMGFIERPTAEGSLNAMSVAFLKTVLKSLGLKQSGKKSELIQRILENADSSFLRGLTNNTYELTEIGKKELSENYYVVYFHETKHKYYDLDVFWANRQVFLHPAMRYRDLMWGELNRHTIEAMKKTQHHDFDDYIKNRQIMAEFLIEEKQQLRKALELESEATYYIANVKPAFFYQELHLIEYFKNTDLLKKEDFLVSRYAEIKELLSMSDSDLFDTLNRNFSKCRSNIIIVKNTDLAGLIVSMINGNSDLTEKIFREIWQRQKSIKQAQIVTIAVMLVIAIWIIIFIF